MSSCEVTEIAISYSASARCIDSSNDSSEFSLSGNEAILSKEGVQVALVDRSLAQSVDRLESSVGGEVVPDLELSLEEVQLSEQGYLALNDSDDASLDVEGQVLVPGYSQGGSVLSQSSQAIVLAGEQYLLEFSQGQAAILIIIEKPDNSVELTLRN